MNNIDKQILTLCCDFCDKKEISNFYPNGKELFKINDIYGSCHNCTRGLWFVSGAINFKNNKVVRK